MKRLERATCPDWLLTAGTDELTEAQAYFGQGHVSGFAFKAYKNSVIKAALSAMTSGKCAYCEADYDVTQPQDVEHYRPKGGIMTATGLIQPGYWWLATSWENLLPSCIRCNRVEELALYDGTIVKLGKGNHFPLSDEAARASQIGEEAGEVPLLLNPCVDDPMQFIEFSDDNGLCIARSIDVDDNSAISRRALESIRIYGLNRAALVRARSRYMKRAKFTLRRLEILLRTLDAISAGSEQEAAEIEESIDLELDNLDDLTSGEDSFSGMLAELIRPIRARFGLEV